MKLIWMLVVIAMMMACVAEREVTPCEHAAQRYCCGLGFCGDAYCDMVFSQSCSDGDQQDAIAFCDANPSIRHDAECHPQW